MASKKANRPDDRCGECGVIHGPGNTNTMCPLASNYRPRPDGMALIDEALGGKVVATPPDKPITHCGVEVPGNSAPQAEWDAFHANVELRNKKQAFLDSVAVELFGKGWPHADIYSRAEVLWEIREHYLAGKPYTKQMGQKR